MESIVLDSGSLSLTQLQSIFKSIPVEFDFIDDQDIVRWYSDNRNRIFARQKDALNKHVLDVHPAKSKQRIENLLKQMHGANPSPLSITVPVRKRLMNMSFYPVLDDSGTYLGCIEVTQDVGSYPRGSKLGHLWRTITKQK